MRTHTHTHSHTHYSVQVLSRPISYEDLSCDNSRALKDVAIQMLDKEPDNRPTPLEVAHQCRQILEGNTSGGKSDGERHDILKSTL